MVGSISAYDPSQLRFTETIQTTLYRLMHSIVMSRPLVVCVNICLFLLDVGFAILLIRKSAAAHLAGFACCVPTYENRSMK
jgi:hypothetical protein